MVCRYMGAGLALVMCCLGASPAASANCDAVIRLAQIYDSFLVITKESGDIRTRAAARLYPQLATMDFESFADELETEFSKDDVVAALKTARSLSREVIMDANLSPFRILDSRDEAELLAHFVERSGCLKGASGGGGGGGKPKDQQDDEGKRSLQFGPKSKSQSKSAFVDTSNTTTLAALIAAGLLALGTMGYLIARSRRVKIHMAQRLPRHQISMDVTAAFTTLEGTSGQHRVKALDISVGGMKLKVPEPLSNGTMLELALPTGEATGTVIWSNAHYAGVLFDQRLDEDTLGTLLKTA